MGVVYVLEIACCLQSASYF